MGRPANGRPQLRVGQRNLLNELESVVRGIRYAVDSAEVFHAQVHYALLQAGCNVTREVAMAPPDGIEVEDDLWRHNRRVDLVVVDHRGTVAIELDNNEVPPRTQQKMLDLPAEVLRVCILRQCTTVPTVRGVDRVICMTSDLRMVPWLVTGSAILEERAAEVIPLPRLRLDERGLRRARAAGEARRLIGGGSYAPRRRTS